MSKPAKKPRVRWVTARWLRDRKACPEAYNAFIEKYGSKAKVRPIEVVETCYCNRHEDWAWWVLNRTLPRYILDAYPAGHVRDLDYRYARMISAEAKP